MGFKQYYLTEKKVVSAGLMQYQLKDGKLKIFLGRPGGPHWDERPDSGTWGIMKGMIDGGEDKFKAAKREFEEETGVKPKVNNKIYLGTVISKFKDNVKTIHAYAFEGNHKFIKSNKATMDWQGKTIEVPEITKAQFFDEKIARKKINKTQYPLIDRLKKELGVK